MVDQRPETEREPKHRVEAVVVLYRPDPNVLAALLAAVAPQVARVTLVANDGANPLCPLPANASLVDPGRNLGLGAAYNLAATAARGRGATHLLLLDQDSVPAAGMVAALLQSFADAGLVAAVGPLWRNRRSGRDGFFIQLAPWGLRKLRPPPNSVVPVDFLISSGSLVSLAALAEIGPFDAELFIEHVDTDWTFRARARGYRLYGVADARLDHAFGGETLARIFTFDDRRFRYPPERNYYLLRNSLILWRRAHAPWPWLLRDIGRVAVLMVVYAFFVPPRRERIACMRRALRDAFRSHASRPPQDCRTGN